MDDLSGAELDSVQILGPFKLPSQNVGSAPLVGIDMNIVRANHDDHVECLRRIFFVSGNSPISVVTGRRDESPEIKSA